MSDHGLMEPMARGDEHAGNGSRPAGPLPISEVSLLVDVGSAWTKASLIGTARGRWRLVAHAAQPSAWNEESLVASLVERASELVDRRLRDELRRTITGAPRISSHTPLRAGRLAIAAVTGEVSGAAARRAAESAGWIVDELVAADDGRPLPERLAALAGAEVDAWLVVGGFDSAAPEQAVEVAAMVAAARGGGRSPVIWAGSRQLAEEVASLFAPAPLTVVPNPRPAPGEEDLDPLRHRLEELLDRLVESGGTRNLAPIGFRRAIAEIAREEHLRVAGADLGSRYATWVVADGTGDEVVVESRVFAAGGLGGFGSGGATAPGRIARSLALPIDELAVADTLQNMRSRPGTVPFNDEELAVTHAAARARLSALVDGHGLEGIDLLIGAGRVFAAAPTPMHAMQILVDGLRPWGVTQLAVDVAGVLAPLGSLSDEEIGEGIGVLRDDLLLPLGTAVLSRGGRVGQLAMRSRLHRTGWPDAEPVEIHTGEVLVLPLPRGERAELEIDLEGGATLPAARRSQRITATVSGGTVGVVLDARDIPLQLPRRQEDRREVMAGWREILLREPVAGHAPEPARASRITARDRFRRLADRSARWRRDEATPEVPDETELDEPDLNEADTSKPATELRSETHLAASPGDLPETATAARSTGLLDRWRPSLPLRPRPKPEVADKGEQQGSEVPDER